MRSLVLLPGFMCDADLWTDMAGDLARLGEVHYGNVYQDDTLEGMAQRVLAESPERFVLIGFSMGGFVARVLTLMAPERVTGVAFVASSAREYTPAERQRRIQGAMPGDKPKTANPGVALGLHPDRERDPALLERLRSMQRRLGSEVRTRQSALIRKDGYADLERIACPSLVIACRQDRLRKFEETERMARCLPQSQFAAIEECGHMAPLEKPHELAMLLAKWIDAAGTLAMDLSDNALLGFAIALGIGLLIGIDRERQKGDGPTRMPAGVRTFTITALAGAVAGAINSDALMAAVTVGVVALAGLSYWRSPPDDPGLTSEMALIVTALLGMLAISQPALAASTGVVVAAVLYSRAFLHRFVRSCLNEGELRDALIFAAATLVVLPLLPDDSLDPYGVLNLRKIWIVVILIMAISGAGYIAVRLLGVRFGLPVSGFASGFVSSSATIGAMASRVKDTPALLRPAVAGAVLSTVATIVQLALLLAAVNVTVLKAMAIPLALSGLVAVLYGGAFTLWALKHEGQTDAKPGRAFGFGTALALAATLAVILIASAALQAWLGETGIVLAAGVAGFADAHSAAVSAAQLASAQRIGADQAVLPVLAALTTNTVTKIVLAFTGHRTFALCVVPGLLLVLAAAWAGVFLAGGKLV